MNRNACEGCEYWGIQRSIERDRPENAVPENKLHCYMFRTEPEGTCGARKSAELAHNLGLLRSCLKQKLNAR